jgi:hypothetical protein
MPAAEGIVKERLVRITRVPLVLVAMWIAFAEIARGPALSGSDLYRGGPPESHVEWRDRFDLDDNDAMAIRSENPITIPWIAPWSNDALAIDDDRSVSKWPGRIRDLRENAIEPLFALQLEAANP